MVMERWGAWAVDNSGVFVGHQLLQGPNKIKSRVQCCDDDGVIISNRMATLNKKNSEAHDLLFDYYVFGKTFMQLARDHECSDGHIGKKLQKAEGVIEGMLMMLDVSLEMDKYVQKEPLDINQQQLCGSF